MNINIINYISLQVVSALAYLHERKILHRDVKVLSLFLLFMYYYCHHHLYYYYFYLFIILLTYFSFLFSSSSLTCCVNFYMCNCTCTNVHCFFFPFSSLYKHYYTDFLLHSVQCTWILTL